MLKSNDPHLAGGKQNPENMSLARSCVRIGRGITRLKTGGRDLNNVQCTHAKTGARQWFIKMRCYDLTVPHNLVTHSSEQCAHQICGRPRSSIRPWRVKVPILVHFRFRPAAATHFYYYDGFRWFTIFVATTSAPTTTMICLSLHCHVFSLASNSLVWTFWTSNIDYHQCRFNFLFARQPLSFPGLNLPGNGENRIKTNSMVANNSQKGSKKEQTTDVFLRTVLACWG